MPLPRPLPDIQRELRELLSSSDIKAAFDRLHALLPQNTPRQDELFLLLGRFNAIEQLAHQGVAPDEEILRLRNQLRHDLLHFVNQLGEADLGGAAATTQVQPGAAQQGLLVYQVPQRMTLGEETRCLVRIALDRDVLLEDLDIVKHTRERALKKISKSMQVELADPSGGKNFSIRGTSKAVQTIDFDGAEHTEWRFYVTPLREGQYILEVKVSVIELVDGERTYRERVLEEEVLIVSRAAAPAVEVTPFKPAGEALAFVEAVERSNPNLKKKGLQAAAVLLLATASIYWWQSSQPAAPIEIVATNSVLTDTLSDGSVVTLWRDSRLSLAAGFNRQERRLRLRGGAFFQVAYHPDRPFVVEALDLQVKAVGTAFNVDNRSDTAQALVRVTEGQVLVSTTRQSFLLKSGEAATYDSRKSTLTRGLQFLFERTPLDTALQQISTAYGVSVTLKNKAQGKCLITARYNNLPLETILDLLMNTFSLTLEKTPDGGYVLDGIGCGE